MNADAELRDPGPPIPKGTQLYYKLKSVEPSGDCYMLALYESAKRRVPPMALSHLSFVDGTGASVAFPDDGTSDEFATFIRQMLRCSHDYTQLLQETAKELKTIRDWGTLFWILNTMHETHVRALGLRIVRGAEGEADIYLNCSLVVQNGVVQPCFKGKPNINFDLLLNVQREITKQTFWMTETEIKAITVFLKLHDRYVFQDSPANSNTSVFNQRMNDEIMSMRDHRLARTMFALTDGAHYTACVPVRPARPKPPRPRPRLPTEAVGQDDDLAKALELSAAEERQKSKPPRGTSMDGYYEDELARALALSAAEDRARAKPKRKTALGEHSLDRQELDELEQAIAASMKTAERSKAREKAAISKSREFGGTRRRRKRTQKRKKTGRTKRR